MQLIKNAFDVEVWEFLHDFGRIGKKQKDLIYLFMEQNGIQETGSDWDAIAKIYQRLRNIYLTKLHRKKKKKNTNVWFIWFYRLCIKFYLVSRK